MPAFPAPDGTEVAYHVIGSGSDSAAPAICLPGGPMRASAYLGDLGGLAAHRQLILLDLRGTGESGHPADSASYRCDRQVGDVEALREHLGLHRMELLAHSAGGSLAVRYAAENPHRIGALALITPSTRAVGIEVPADTRRQILALRQDEPWYPAAAVGFEAIAAGRARKADRIAVTPMAYSRWDTAAQAHQATRPASATTRPPGSSTPKGRSTRRPPAPDWVRWTRQCCCSPATSTGSSPRSRPPNSPACSRTPNSSSSPAPVITRGWMARLIS